jgi:hypothetical protein
MGFGWNWFRLWVELVQYPVQCWIPCDGGECSGPVVGASRTWPAVNQQISVLGNNRASGLERLLRTQLPVMLFKVDN